MGGPIFGGPPSDRERHHTFLLPADKNADVMAGAGTAILDHEGKLRMESVKGRIQDEASVSEDYRRHSLPDVDLDCLPSNLFTPLL